MRLFVTILAVLIMATNVFTQTSEKRVALVIGNKNYRYGGALTYPIQDANTIKVVLAELNFEVIYLTDGTKTQMTSSFLQFIRKVGNADISLIYYSGHGMQIDGINHLIPIDANITDKYSAREFTININNWVSQLEANDQNLNIVILDACRNNPFKAFTKSSEKGLKQIPAPSGTIISFATLPENVAQDNGLFAKTLAFEMRKDQRIIDVFMNTRNTVEDKTNKQQSPMEWVRYNRAINLISDGSGSNLPAVGLPPDNDDYVVREVRTPGYFIDPRDKNKYKVVKIGNQTWMVENLKATKFNDGTAIPFVTSNDGWTQLKTAGYCWYNNDEVANKNTYGALYNWYAVNTGKLCPTGWHVPTDDDWKQLEMKLGMSHSKADETGPRGTDEGKKLRSTTGWSSGYNGTDEAGFTALPGGARYGYGVFRDFGVTGNWWSATEKYSHTAWYRSLSYDSDKVRRYETYKEIGLYVRCVRD